MKKLLLVGALVVAAVVTSATAGTARAGEITGNGKATAGPSHANSICVFSGKNDDPTAPLSLPKFKVIGRYFAGESCQLLSLGLPTCKVPSRLNSHRILRITKIT